eukprot:evm.model.scf_518.5 EVM.evm.TU.scf_518.5   scf_518:35477-37786(+)
MALPAWLLVTVCTLVQMVIGSLWYGPINGKLFLNIAFGTDRPPNNPNGPLAVSALTAVLICSTLHWVVTALGYKGLGAGLQMAFVLWALGVLINLPHPLFEDRPIMLFVIHESYHLVSLVAICGILTMFA